MRIRARAKARARLKAKKEPALAAYERKYAPLWLILSVAFICSLVLEFTAPAHEVPYYLAFDFLLWGAFMFDLAWRYHITVEKGTWYWKDPVNVLDLIVVGTFPALVALHMAVLGSGRVFVIVIRLARGAALIGATATRAGRFFRRGTLTLLSIIALELVVTLTILVMRAEDGVKGHQIHGTADAVWWALVTLFTIGYGDKYPVSPWGRVIAVLVMFVGIALFSWLTASLASVFVENEGKLGSRASQKVMLNNQKEMLSILAAIQERLDRLEERE